MKIDVREHESRIKLAKQYFPEATVELLSVGDYVYQNLGIEWKQDDFVSSVGHHLFQQAEELRSNFKVPVLMVPKRFSDIREEMKYHKTKDPHAAFNGTIASLIVRGIVPLFIEKPEWAFEIMKVLAVKANDGKDRTTTPIRNRGVPRVNSLPVKGKRTPTVLEYQLSILMGFPQMSITRAKAVMQEFNSLQSFFTAEPKEVQKRVRGVATLANRWKELLEHEQPTIVKDESFEDW